MIRHDFGETVPSSSIDNGPRKGGARFRPAWRFYLPTGSQHSALPYASDAPVDPRVTSGNLSYFAPDPATGIHVSAGRACAQSTQTGDPCNDFLGIRSARSSAYLDLDNGAVIGQVDIAQEEQEAFDRYLASLQLVVQ
jgi:hypothetical protein